MEWIQERRIWFGDPVEIQTQRLECENILRSPQGSTRVCTLSTTSNTANDGFRDRFEMIGS